MFRPDSNRDRTDYSGILMPPDGYRLDRAVGTTYSLDLEALTAVAICLGLSEETVYYLFLLISQGILPRL